MKRHPAAGCLALHSIPFQAGCAGLPVDGRPPRPGQLRPAGHGHGPQVGLRQRAHLPGEAGVIHGQNRFIYFNYN